MASQNLEINQKMQNFKKPASIKIEKNLRKKLVEKSEEKSPITTKESIGIKSIKNSPK